MNEIFLDDLRDKTHRGLAGQAEKGYWCGGRPYGFKLKPILDTSNRDAYGQPVRIGTLLEIHFEQAAIVRETYRRFAEGASCTMIADDLNGRKVASPGSTWRRKTRRYGGWMNSAVRTILKNLSDELVRGALVVALAAIDLVVLRATLPILRHQAILVTLKSDTSTYLFLARPPSTWKRSPRAARSSGASR